MEGRKACFYLTDHLGTPRELVDEAGKRVWSGDYTALGRCSVDEASKISNNIRFQGQYFDEETGLHYNMFRFYDPEVGRYVTKDPIGFHSKDFNFYRYVLNNPLGEIDPLGLDLLESMKSIYDLGNNTNSAAELGNRRPPIVIDVGQKDTNDNQCGVGQKIGQYLWSNGQNRVVPYMKSEYVQQQFTTFYEAATASPVSIITSNLILTNIGDGSAIATRLSSLRIRF